MERRIFLRGLGGASVAAPFLGSLAGRSARAQSASNAPKRFIAMFTHYGSVTTHFFPQSSHGELTAADLEPTSLSPLAPFADKLLMPRGIRAMNEWSTQLTTGQGTHTHQGAASYFTCQPVTPNNDDPLDPNLNVGFAPKALGPSLDHVMGQQLSPGGIPLFMRVGGSSDDGYSAISYSEAETPFAGLGTVEQAFFNLTGLLSGTGSISPDSYQAARGKSLLDLVKDDLETLERFDMSQSDKDKLAAWKELLHETGQVAYSAQCSEEGALSLGFSAENIDAASIGINGDISTKITDSLDAADLYSNIAVLAALCDANRVIFLKYPADYVFKGLDLIDTNHSLSHRSRDGMDSDACDELAFSMIVKIDEFYARKFAHLVGKLDSFDEGEGTLLDNTAAVWFQEMSDGLAHNLNNLPIIQAGSAGGYFRTGQAINVDDGESDLPAGSSESYCNDGGLPGGGLGTGTDAQYGNAPINKYFCSLMNAVGVKGGPDGFAQVGGSGEVTHFGMYDDTTNFVGGGTTPPAIFDPGEFAELKA